MVVGQLGVYRRGARRFATRVKFVCISDTHLVEGLPKIPDGDVLVHTGDFSKRGSPASLEQFNSFLKALPHPVKLLISGNHDHTFDPESWPHLLATFHHPFSLFPARDAITAAVYIQDSGYTAFGIRVWGCPWICSERAGAFSVTSEEVLVDKYAKIPADVDVLMTHGPAFRVLDTNLKGVLRGSKALKQRLELVRPKVHVFGHIHEAYGLWHVGTGLSINASVCDVRQQPVNSPVIFTLPLP